MIYHTMGSASDDAHALHCPRAEHEIPETISLNPYHLPHATRQATEQNLPET